MFRVFHLPWSTCWATRTFVVGQGKLLRKVERGFTLSNNIWLCWTFSCKVTTCHTTNLLSHRLWAIKVCNCLNCHYKCIDHISKRSKNNFLLQANAIALEETWLRVPWTFLFSVCSDRHCVFSAYTHCALSQVGRYGHVISNKDSVSGFN